MKYARKVVVVPFDEEEEGEPHQDGGEIVEPPQPKGNRIKQYALDRQRKFLSIILKIASINGYDAEGRIKLRDGRYMERSDILNLLTHALSPGRSVSGLQEFVELLREANVPSEMIINENVRAMMEGKRVATYAPPVHVVSNTAPPERRVAKKRHHDNIVDVVDAQHAPTNKRQRIEDESEDEGPPLLKRFDENPTNEERKRARWESLNEDD